MTVLILIATMSFAIDMHFCGDLLVNFSLVQKAQSCGMDEVPTEDCIYDFTKKSCCTDKQIVSEGQDDFKFSFDQLTFEQQAFITSFYYTYINRFEDLSKSYIPFKDYTPPYLIQDIQKLHERYLI